MAEAGRLEVRPRNAESPAKAWLSGERLKGFERSTFCMASRACSPDSVRKAAGNSGFPRFRRGVGFPGFHWKTTGLGTEWAPEPAWSVLAGSSRDLGIMRVNGLERQRGRARTRTSREISSGYMARARGGGRRLCAFVDAG